MTAIGKTMFPLANGIKNITTMKARYDALQTQLSTGQKASTLAEMGSDRFFDLALRQRLSRIGGFQQSISTVNLRVEVLNTVMTRLQTIEADARAGAVTGGGGTAGPNFQTAPTLAASRLDEVLSLMNSDIAGRYLFAGNSTENKPAASASDVLNGVGGKAGFIKVAGERKLADMGASPDHLGRLTVTPPAAGTGTLTIDEDGNHPFGLKLSTSSSSSAITLTSTNTQPRKLEVQFGAALPVAGDKVTVGFTLPDGTEERVTLTATTGTPGPGEFQIGADADTTAANFGTAFKGAVKNLSEGVLVSASAFAAAGDFFNGMPVNGVGGQPMRIDGPPFETATSMVPATAADTVLWYTGQNSENPRDTVTARVGEGSTVAYGVQATESGIVNLVRTLAAQAIQSFPDSDTTSSTRYDAADVPRCLAPRREPQPAGRPLGDQRRDRHRQRHGGNHRRAAYVAQGAARQHARADRGGAHRGDRHGDPGAQDAAGGELPGDRAAEPAVPGPLPQVAGTSRCIKSKGPRRAGLLHSSGRGGLSRGRREARRRSRG